MPSHRHKTLNDAVTSVGPRLRMQLSVLTPLEAGLVREVLSVGFHEGTSIKQVAEACGMSEPMVVKTAKKLGFDGFRDLRQAVAAYNRLPVTEMHREVALTDSAGEIVTKVFRTSIQALEETMAILDMKAFERAANLLMRAQRRDFYGVGGSAQIAQDAAHKFLRIGVRATAYNDPHLMLMSAALLEAKDVVLAVSHSGQTSAVVEAVQAAQASGASIIALTNYAESRLASLADTVLCSTARGSPLTGENAAARIAQLNILDALFVAVAQKDYARAEQQLGRTMAAVAHKRN
jgi:RpiR family transcriptional regulator, repressor of rpiB and als operon